MKKFLYDKATVQTIEDDERIRLQYFLLEDEIEIDSCFLKCYGFEIKKTSFCGSLELSEVKQIQNVFFNHKEATDFLKKIAAARVTPMTLSGILEDYISDAIHSENRLPVMV